MTSVPRGHLSGRTYLVVAPGVWTEVGPGVKVNVGGTENVAVHVEITPTPTAPVCDPCPGPGVVHQHAVGPLPVPAGVTRVDGLHLTHVVARKLDQLVERTGRTHTDLINAAIVLAGRHSHSAELARQLVAWPASPCATGCVDPAAHAEGGHDV